MANGFILYQGPSLLDGAPIVCIATGLESGSTNRKTGAMVQTYILRSGVSPTVAVQTGDDASICGDCPHRGRVEDGRNVGRTCYVNVGQGPGAVFRAYRAGKYPVVAPAVEDYRPVFGGRLIRFGTYGDPAAVPADIWVTLAAVASGWTGYTHQWRKAPTLRHYCMASVDTIAEANEAQQAGWRTFRVALPNAAARIMNEVICPASAEAGKKLTCAQCLACGGASKGRRGSIVIKAHGGFAVMANVRRREAVG